MMKNCSKSLYVIPNLYCITYIAPCRIYEARQLFARLSVRLSVSRQYDIIFNVMPLVTMTQLQGRTCYCKYLPRYAYVSIIAFCDSHSSCLLYETLPSHQSYRKRETPFHLQTTRERGTRWHLSLIAGQRGRKNASRAADRARDPHKIYRRGIFRKNLSCIQNLSSRSQRWPRLAGRCSRKA